MCIRDRCGISEQKIRRDAYACLDHLESLTEDEEITSEQAHKNAVELAEHTKAVSYTHLDVYKRQLERYSWGA